MIGYRQCLECAAIHRDGRLGTEWKPGTLDLIPHCSDCGCTRLRWLDPRHESVCDSCEKAIAMKGDDYCAACALLIDARDEADFHADNQQEPGFYREAV